MYTAKPVGFVETEDQCGGISLVPHRELSNENLLELGRILCNENVPPHEVKPANT
jgi:hypothetical protein